MDRNTIIGIVVIVAILVGFGIWNKPSEKELAKEQRFRDSIEIVQRQQEAREALAKQEILQNQGKLVPDGLNDSAKNALIKKEYGAFASSATGEKQYLSLENEKIKVVFSNLGGRPYTVFLKGYRTYDSLPLQLFNGDSTVFGFGLSTIGKNTSQLFFTPVTKGKEIIVKKDSASVVYRLMVDSSKYIEYTYTIHSNDYIVDLKVSFSGMESVISEEYLTLNWEQYSPQQEKGRKWEDQNTGLHYQYLDEDEHDYLSETSSEEKKEKLTGRVKWIAYKQQFFASVLIADDFFLKGSVVTSQMLETDPKHLKKFTSSIDLSYSNKPIGMSFYFGPNKYKTLKSYGIGMEKLLPLGWGIFGWVNKFVVIPIFNFLSEYIGSFGLIILLLTIIIKIVLFPLTFKSYLSTAKMRVLKPEVDEINKKYPKKEDALKKQQAVMEMYKKGGVNPLSGCIPLLIQMPILIAMFRFFPASIELRQQSFMWATDLSTYDSIMQLPFNIPMYGDHISLFTLLMAGSMVLINLQTGNNMMTAPGQPNMKFLMWLMPIMMVLWFNNYSSGLSYYYLIANLITVGQTFIIQKSVNDKKILAQIHENRKKPMKKSSFQQKLEDMARKKGMNVKR